MNASNVSLPLRLGPTIRAVDLHAAGEPGRVIIGGVDGVPAGSVGSRRRLQFAAG